MPTEIDDQLTMYFGWLEGQIGFDLHPPSHATDQRVGDSPDHGPTISVEEHPSRHDRRSRSTRVAVALLLAAASVVTVLVVAATRSTERPTDSTATVTPADSSVPPTTDGALGPLLEPGESRVLSASPLVGRTDPAVVWAGDRMLVWGGSTLAPNGGESPLDDGAAYDPVSDEWTPMSAAPITGRSNAAAVWTGTEMLIWGGSDNGESLSDGAGYDPVTNSWRSLPSYELGFSIRPSTVWTGVEMIVIEGFNGAASAAGAFNPATNTWRSTTAAPGRSVAPYPQAVWTGDRVIAELSVGLDDQPVLAEYDPAADTWSLIDGFTIGTNARPKLVWTGTELLVLTAPANAAWNPLTRSWRGLAERGDVRLTDTEPVWTGNSAVFWAGGPSAAVYVATTDTWQSVEAGALDQRTSPPNVWAAGLLLSWSGFRHNIDGTAVAANDGIAWRPPVLVDPATPPASTYPVSTATFPDVSPTVPRSLISTLVLGESVMQGAQNALTAAGLTVDAQESLQAQGVIEQLLTAREQYVIADAVVIQSGTNGPVSQAQYDEMAGLVADIPHVYFLTIKAPVAWAEPNNDIIRALPMTHPNVTVVDWAVLGQTIEGELSAGDGGVHLNSGAAVRFYANMILGALGKPLIPDP